MELASNAPSLGVPAIAVALFLALSAAFLLLAARRAWRAEGDARTAAWFGFCAWAGLDLFAATGELLLVLLAAARFIFPLWPVLRYREPTPAEVAT